MSTLLTGNCDREAILTARGLTKVFRGFTAVNNVDLTVRSGSIHALIGPNGAGKTTCFNLLTRFLVPTRGMIHFRGTDISRSSPADIARMGLVRSFQISSTFPHLSVLENVRIALQRPNGLATQFWRPQSSLDRLNERAMELLSSVGLESFRDQAASVLSYGRKRALELATTLALDPELLLLDEPMAGMAREDIHQIAHLIRKVAEGRTIVMVEHNLSVVADLCDRVTVLQRGEVLAEGRYEEISQDPRVREAYMGSAV
ncbi:branched-chain amino acid transport system ATP-binding protein [Rhizobium petrolearium]|uniref:ABC transporter ATP-binding protein n=2 Tax=Neorhizobium TaxID=1525371 RepID=A0ABV0MD10_9HYPH|nr:ABC transporter ATP-binding protein [Neorhizobium petrolearium]MBP1848513.1 branched-chain amino acid transport system ATP-binding protein [Neorhizobium petrolearium]MCC2614522.1 ABC transporter ATP-binding protein [Neorhizobium petrolearium]WGI72281.1 ABC transporter ATP-binding protein [Neorhizobium petrolearium]